MTALKMGAPELTYSEEEDRETGRKMAEVDYVIGAPFAVTWQNQPRSRAFWSGYAIGWMDAEEVATRGPEEPEFIDPWEEPYVPEDQFENDLVYLDLYGER